MKRICILFLGIIMATSMSSCSNKSRTVEDLFKDYVGKTFIQNVNISDEDLIKMSFFKNIHGANYIHFSDEKTVKTMSFFGKIDDNITYDYFQSTGLLRYKNKSNEKQMLETYSLIEGTDFFIDKSECGKDLPAYQTIYWFNTFDKAKPTIENSLLMSIMDDDKNFEDTYLLSEVKKKLESMEPNKTMGKLVNYYQASDTFSFESQKVEFDNATVEKANYGFNETLNFDSLSITFTGVTLWTEVANHYSDHFRKPVFYLNMKVLNNQNTPHSLDMLSYTIYGPNGHSICSVSTYFEGTVDYADEILPGQELVTFLPVLYQTHGDYLIVFEKGSDYVVAKLNVNRD